MKRPIVILVAAIGLVVATSGCSIREVQLWFQATGHGTITADKAKSVADLVNSKKTAGCDTGYAANGGIATTCVPNNVASVHCAGTHGDGPIVFGPLKVTGFDSFNLDADGDKNACVDPVGSVDVLGQSIENNIHVAGWTFDPNTTDPIHLTVTDNGVASDQTASVARPDVNTIYAGVGANHGYDFTIDETASPAATHQICLTAKNVGVGTDQKLGCKTITLLGLAEDSPAGHDVFGVIEGADRVPGGIHIRGFAFDSQALPTLPTVGFGSSDDPTVVTSLATKQTVARPDVVAALNLGVTATGTYGFDFVQPAPAGSSFADSSSICLYDSTGTSSNVQMTCRAINS